MDEWRTKTFKAGNSVGLRLPKGMGFEEGEDVVVVPHANGQFSFWRERDSLEVLMSLYGSMSPGFMADGRGDIDQDERDWNKPASASEAA